MVVWTTECYIVDADSQNILEQLAGGGYLCSNPVSTYYIFSRYIKKDRQNKTQTGTG